MIAEGENAPRFELPAVVDGEGTTVVLEDHLGPGVVVLAFYPGDFNPGCEEERADLDALDLLQMQKDVSVLAISDDSVHSHRAFAREYDLRVPLLADVRGTVAADYGVAVEDATAGYGTERAVFVLDHEGVIEYAWHSDDVARLPPVERVREAIEGVGGAEVATARYRVGHAHYVEGRRAFTSAMKTFESREWTLAQGDFEQARREFETAADEFDTATKFAEESTPERYYERANRKANALWQAAEWLAESSNAFASGEGATGESMRADARTPLETARSIPDPPDPDELPSEADPEASDQPSFVDDSEDDIVSSDDEADLSFMRSAGTTSADDGRWTVTDRTDGDANTDDPGIDEEELEEITADIEEQSEVIDEEQSMESDTADRSAGPEGELDLSDPTDGSSDGLLGPEDETDGTLIGDLDVDDEDSTTDVTDEDETFIPDADKDDE